MIQPQNYWTANGILDTNPKDIYIAKQTALPLISLVTAVPWWKLYGISILPPIVRVEQIQPTQQNQSKNSRLVLPKIYSQQIKEGIEGMEKQKMVPFKENV